MYVVGIYIYSLLYRKTKCRLKNTIHSIPSYISVCQQKILTLNYSFFHPSLLPISFFLATNYLEVSSFFMDFPECKKLKDAFTSCFEVRKKVVWESLKNGTLPPKEDDCSHVFSDYRDCYTEYMEKYITSKKNQK